MLLYRLGTAAHPLWDGAGAARFGGRWNPVGVPVIYAAGSLALAMLERLVQRSGLRATMLAEARVPDDLAVEDAAHDPPPGWRAPGSARAAQLGADFVVRARAAILRLPSVIVPREPNYVVNPAHPDCRRIEVTAPEPLDWDARLFGIPAPAREP